MVPPVIPAEGDLAVYRRALSIAIATLVIVAADASAPRTLAQVEISERPADIRSGSCASLGEVVAPLTSVVVPSGEAQGQAGATPVEQSVTTIPLFVEDLLASGYALAAYASAQEAGTPIVCGDIGGTLAADGTLAVGLNEMNGSRYSGVAYFVPTADGSGATVTVMLMDQRAGRRGDGAADGAAVGGGSPDVVEPADTTTTGDATGSGNVAPAPAPAPIVTTPPATAGVDGVETISATNADGENAKPRNKDKATAERDAHGNGGTVTSDGSTNQGDGNADKSGERAKREGGAHAGEDGGANG
jgi:hypothetical protein